MIPPQHTRTHHTHTGSLSARILSFYGDTPRGMVESAFEFAQVCRKHDYHNFLFSMKASNPLVMVQVRGGVIHVLSGVVCLSVPFLPLRITPPNQRRCHRGVLPLLSTDYCSTPRHRRFLPLYPSRQPPTPLT